MQEQILKHELARDGIVLVSVDTTTKTFVFSDTMTDEQKEIGRQMIDLILNDIELYTERYILNIQS